MERLVGKTLKIGLLFSLNHRKLLHVNISEKRDYDRTWYQKNKVRLRADKTALMRKLRAANPEKYRGHSRAAKARLKAKVFGVYGSTCVRCGFADLRALTLDHVKNNGANERESLGERGVYRRALVGENRADYQTLCMNCQFIKRVEGSRSNQHPAVVRLAWETLTPSATS